MPLYPIASDATDHKVKVLSRSGRRNALKNRLGVLRCGVSFLENFYNYFFILTQASHAESGYASSQACRVGLLQNAKLPNALVRSCSQYDESVTASVFRRTLAEACVWFTSHCMAISLEKIILTTFGHPILMAYDIMDGGEFVSNYTTGGV